MTFNKSIHEIIAGALFDHAYTEREKFLNEGGQLAYYTTADTALSIFRGKEIWMRSATVMNDYSEVHFGFCQMREAWKTSEGNQFWRALEDISPRITSSVEGHLLTGSNDLAHDTYLTCLSKIGPDDLARELGKLSMWRAYGGDSGVALILNSTPFQGDSTALGVYSQPVIYGTSQQLAKQLGQIASRLFDAKKEIQDYLETGEDAVAYLSSLIALSIEFLIVCLKHPAFEEENEWRVICPLKRKGYKLKQEIHCIGGIPQIVLKIPLEDDPTANLHGYGLNNLISQVLIGPTQHPEAIKAALCHAMRDSGIIRPEDRVKLTYIPLRPNNR